MTAPNLYAINSVEGQTNADFCPVILTSILNNSSNSNEVLRVNSLYISNVQNGSASVDLVFRKNNNNMYIAYNNLVTSGTTSVIITRETFLYLEESSSLWIRGSIAGYLQYVVSFEKIS